MADSAFYTCGNIQSLGEHCFWISHVPMTIPKAQERVASEVSWTACKDTRYKYAVDEVHMVGYGRGGFWITSAKQQKRIDTTFRTRLYETDEER
ncbi:hypothetical protein [Methanoregula sp.]|jgi:transposase|uniref:hypothetical protein n=1 Tax=Methanoregula sp. TaxID=2052170 RepID=UPI003567D31E